MFIRVPNIPITSAAFNTVFELNLQQNLSRVHQVHALLNNDVKKNARFLFYKKPNNCFSSKVS